MNEFGLFGHFPIRIHIPTIRQDGDFPRHEKLKRQPFIDTQLVHGCSAPINRAASLQNRWRDNADTGSKIRASQVDSLRGECTKTAGAVRRHRSRCGFHRMAHRGERWVGTEASRKPAGTGRIGAQLSNVSPREGRRIQTDQPIDIAELT